MHSLNIFVVDSLRIVNEFVKVSHDDHSDRSRVTTGADLGQTPCYPIETNTCENHTCLPGLQHMCCVAVRSCAVLFPALQGQVGAAAQAVAAVWWRGLNHFSLCTP
jgi:hypothetical protein